MTTLQLRFQILCLFSFGEERNSFSAIHESVECRLAVEPVKAKIPRRQSAFGHPQSILVRLKFTCSENDI